MVKFEEYVAAVKSKMIQAGLAIGGEKFLEYGLQLSVSDGKDKVAVNIYNGKKGVNLVIGGSAKSPLKEAVESVLGSRDCRSELKGTEEECVPPGFEQVEGFDGCWIGTDESGKGDFFGPLVVAAVRVDSAISARLKDVGVKDCKLLRDDNIEKFAGHIRQICAGAFSELEILPPRYNTLYAQFRAEGKNLNHLLAWAHARVLEELLEKADCRFALTDKFADEKFVKSRLMAKGRQIVLVQTPKAERNIAVAAASILARDRFLHRMEKLSENFGLVLPKGASRQVIEAAKLFAAKRGKKALVEVAKLHFKTVEQI